MARFSGYISTVSFLTVMVVTVSMLAVGPKFSFELELSSSELAGYYEEAKYLAMTELTNSPLLHIDNSIQMFSNHHVEDPYLFVSLCFLIPPPTDGYMENRKIMLHLLGRLTPQNRYAFFNISTTRGSTNSVGGAYCNGTVWDHDAYRAKCDYCINYLLTDPDMVPNCNWTEGTAVGFDLGANKHHNVNCQIGFSPGS